MSFFSDLFNKKGKGEVASEYGGKNTSVPGPAADYFKVGFNYVDEYFKTEQKDPGSGKILIGGDRYVFFRAMSFSVGFMDFIQQKFPGMDTEGSFEAAGKLMFDLAFAIGKADAINFHNKMKVVIPFEKVATGPFHIAYCGLGNVKGISPRELATPDSNFYSVYDQANTFESDSWIASGKKAPKPSCFMNGGYASGWMSDSFSTDLAAREVLCRAKGDSCCRFVMGHPNMVDEYVAKYKEDNPGLFK